MHEGVQRTRKSIYVKLIHVQGIVLRVPNQCARVAGGESNRFNADVGLHQRSALSPYMFLILMYVLIVWRGINYQNP